MIALSPSKEIQKYKKLDLSSVSQVASRNEAECYRKKASATHRGCGVQPHSSNQPPFTNQWPFTKANTQRSTTELTPRFRKLIRCVHPLRVPQPKLDTPRLSHSQGHQGWSQFKWVEAYCHGVTGELCWMPVHIGVITQQGKERAKANRCTHVCTISLKRAWCTKMKPNSKWY